MATKTCQAQAPAMPAVAVRAATTGNGNGNGNGRVSAENLPPRRGQIKEKILKDAVTFLAAIVKNSRGGAGVPVPADANNK